MRPVSRATFTISILGLASLAIAVATCLPTGGGPDASRPSPAGAPGVATTASSVDGMRIRIARLGIDLPLREGDLRRDVPSDSSPGATPEGAAFHLPGTAVPGGPGNSYLYSHARAGMFLALWQARVGDGVEVQLADGRVLAYTVVEVHPAVPPTDVSWVQPTSDEHLTLQTSTGPTPDYPRFIVIARRERAT